MVDCLVCREEIDPGTCCFVVRYATKLEANDFDDEGLCGFIHPGCVIRKVRPPAWFCSWECEAEYGAGDPTINIDFTGCETRCWTCGEPIPEEVIEARSVN